MAKPLIWVHGDFLSPNAPTFEQYPDARAVFVFDDELLVFYDISLKRLLFLYESLLELPNLEIRRGDVAEELAAAVQEHGADGIVTVYTVAPRFRDILGKLRKEKKLGVEVLDPEPFADLDEETSAKLDLRRFSRYWQVASKHV
jgi:hypothetical protein